MHVSVLPVLSVCADTCVYAYLCRERRVYVRCRLRGRMKWRADWSGSPLLYQEDSTAGEEDEGSWPGLIKRSLNLTLLSIQ